MAALRGLEIQRVTESIPSAARLDLRTDGSPTYGRNHCSRGLGSLAIVAACQYARRSQSRYVPLVASLGVMTLLSRGFGFVTGLIASLQGRHMQADTQHWIWMVGLSESVVNVAFALLLLSFATGAMVVGAYRIARGAPQPD